MAQYGWQSTHLQYIQCNPYLIQIKFVFFSIFTAVIVCLLSFIDNYIRFDQWTQYCTTFN